MKSETEFATETQARLNGNFVKGVALVFIIVYMASCKQEPVTDKEPVESPIECGTVAKSFTTEVQPLLLASCSECHGAGSGNGPGALTTYNEIFNARSLIRSAVSSGRMPRNGSLTAAQKATIICWIDNGAPNN